MYRIINKPKTGLYMGFELNHSPSNFGVKGSKNIDLFSLEEAIKEIRRWFTESNCRFSGEGENFTGETRESRLYIKPADYVVTSTPDSVYGVGHKK